MAKAFKSEVVDGAILILEERLKAEGKHLIKTETLFSMCSSEIDITDNTAERAELLEIGMRQLMQSRLYSFGYFSVSTGYFVSIAECDNLEYLNMIINSKDDVIEKKVKARNRLKELKALDGQMQFVPDESGILNMIETRTREEIEADLEADAI